MEERQQVKKCEQGENSLLTHYTVSELQTNKLLGDIYVFLFMQTLTKIYLNQCKNKENVDSILLSSSNKNSTNHLTKDTVMLIILHEQFT